MSPTQANSSPATALVIGATGDFGDHMTTVLLARGWRVKALNRRPAVAAKAKPHLAVAWIAGDAMKPADVIAAAEGCAIIVHAVNPPGYRNWRGLALPMLASAIEAAKVTGARIVMPGNVYNYDPKLTPVIDEASPQRPVSRKGAVRVEMEEMLEAAAAGHGVKSLTLRAGDFFGPRSDNGWVAGQMVKPGKPVRAVLTALNAASGAAGTVHMSNARFHGRDGHDRSFVLVAKEATRDGTDPNKVTLVLPDLTLANETGPQPRRVTGRNGLYFDDTKMLYMSGHVVFDDGAGNRFVSEHAEINIQQDTIRGDTAVTGDGPMGHVDALTYSVDSKGDHVVFVGQVHTHLVNQQEQR